MWKMSDAAWSLQDAKNRLSELVARAERGEPQLVTKHGRAAVYVVDAREFDAMRQRLGPRTNLGEHLLNFPTGGPDDFEFERLDLRLRPRDTDD
jgi:antitoxin Phd